MAKTKVSEFDAVASNNTDINSVNVAEGCPPSGINNAIREMASLLKKQEVGTDAMTSPDINGGTIDGATIGASSPSTGAFTTLTASGNLSVDGGTIKLDGNYPVGTANVALGDTALDSLTSGGYNVAIGNGTLSSNTSANGNNAVGHIAMAFNTTGATNNAFGNEVLTANTTGSNNSAFGHQALASNTTASSNTAVGYQALYTNATGSQLTALGYQAGYTFDGTGGVGTFIGYRAGLSITSGANNTVVGHDSMYATTTGQDNASLGKRALRFNTTGSYNTSIGSESLYSNTTASQNTAVGYQAMYNSNASAFNNEAFGYQALYSNTTGTSSVALGDRCGYSNTTGVGNTFVGSLTGYNVTTGSNNTFIGPRNSLNNGAGYYVTTGSKNTIIGGYNGNQDGLDIRTLSNRIVLSDGDGNVRIYVNNAGGMIVNGVSGDGYSGVGASNTMYSIPASGAYALGLTQVTTSAGGGRVLGLRNVTDFNNSSNEVINYNGNTTTRFLVTSNGNVTNTNNSYGAISDVKLKEQITDASSQWNDIKLLTIRKYKMKDEVIANGDSDELWRLGVIAQEVEEVGMNGLVDERADVETDEDGNIVETGTSTKQVKYSVLYMKAVKALQEAMTRIETLEAKVTALENG